MKYSHDFKNRDQDLTLSKLLQCYIYYMAIFYLLCSLYLSEGFLHIQNLVGMSIIEQVYGNRTGLNNFTEVPVNTKVQFL